MVKNVLLSNEQLLLSSSQRSMWFFYKMNPQIPIYNETFSIEMNEQVNALQLEKCLKKIIQRHESLRTVFGEKDGIPFQQVLDKIEFKLEVYDFDEVTNNSIEVISKK